MRVPSARMRFPAGFTVCSSRRLHILQCEARVLTLTRPLFKASRDCRAQVLFNKAQRTLLTTAVANSPYNPDPSCSPHSQGLSRPRLRSPHNWAHIAHRIRLPPSQMATQTRSHAGHSHGGGGHHHHHDNTYLTSANKSDPGVKITRIGLYVNLGMAIAKGTGGYVFNSQA